MEIIVRVAAVAAIALLALGFVLQSISGKFEPPGPAKLVRNFTKRGLAMELAKSPAEVELVFGDQKGGKNQNNRKVMRHIQAADFGFIAAYWMLFTLTAVLLAERHFPLATAVAAAATVFATIAAACDVWEDVFIIKITQSALDASAQPLIDHCRTAALWKWNLLFLAMTLLSSLFLGRTDWRTLTGVALSIPGLLIAAAGIYGLVTLPSGGAVENAMKVMAAGLLALTIAFSWAAFEQDRFLGGL
jgi:hypothetical protein